MVIKKILDGLKNLSEGGAGAEQSPVSAAYEDAKENAKSLGEAAMSKLNTVSRQEYDEQLEAINDIEERIDAISKKIDDIEQSTVSVASGNDAEQPDQPSVTPTP